MTKSEMNISEFFYYQKPSKHLVHNGIVRFDDIEPNIMIVGKTMTKKFHYIGVTNCTPYFIQSSMVYYDGEFYVYFGLNDDWPQTITCGIDWSKK